MSTPVLRIDVFSLKGGVGKSTVSYLLARELGSRTPGRPALLIDADLLGTCVGDMLVPLSDDRWSSRFNLAHLLTVAPETIEEHIHAGRLALYDQGGRPLGKDQAKDAEVWFAPSHAWSGKVDGIPAPDERLIGALAAHETAGDWVHAVMDAVEQGLCRFGAISAPSAVVVDHSPGMAAVQRRALERGVTGKKSGSRYARILVVGPDWVDQRATVDFLEREAHPEHWVVVRNRERRGVDGQPVADHADLPEDNILFPTVPDCLHGGGSLVEMASKDSPLADAVKLLADRLLQERS